MSTRLTNINIVVWRCEDTVTDEDTFDQYLEVADIEHDLGEEVIELLLEKLGEAGLDCDEDGVHFSFNLSAR